MKTMTVIGAGAWGTGLAASLRRSGRNVKLWAREPEVAEAVNAGKGNPLYLKNVELPAGIGATTEIGAALAGADAALLVVPAQFLRQTAAAMRPHLAAGVPVVLCAKGIEQGSGKLMSEVAAEELPGTPLAVLSGPSFAVEVARGLPTAVTLACADEGLAQTLIEAVAGRTFRVYRSDDIVGAEIGGAVKNVLAIACGIVEGRKLGDNARAALITRGLAELIRLGRAKGAKTETMMGLAGLGDLVLTCTAMQSRNFSLGFQLGEGRPLADILASRVAVTEGVASAASVATLADSLGVELPISAGVDAILHHGRDIDAVVADLLARPLTREF